MRITKDSAKWKRALVLNAHSFAIRPFGSSHYKTTRHLRDSLQRVLEGVDEALRKTTPRVIGKHASKLRTRLLWLRAPANELQVDLARIRQEQPVCELFRQPPFILADIRIAMSLLGQASAPKRDLAERRDLLERARNLLHGARGQLMAYLRPTATAGDVGGAVGMTPMQIADVIYPKGDDAEIRIVEKVRSLDSFGIETTTETHLEIDRRSSTGEPTKRIATSIRVANHRQKKKNSRR